VQKENLQIIIIIIIIIIVIVIRSLTSAVVGTIPFKGKVLREP
jgi:hypothetical protein